MKVVTFKELAAVLELPHSQWPAIAYPWNYSVYSRCAMALSCILAHGKPCYFSTRDNLIADARHAIIDSYRMSLEDWNTIFVRGTYLKNNFTRLDDVTPAFVAEMIRSWDALNPLEIEP